METRRKDQIKPLELKTTVADITNAFNRNTKNHHVAKERNKEKLKYGKIRKTDHPFLPIPLKILTSLQSARMSLH